MHTWYQRKAREAVRDWPSDTCTLQRSSSRPYGVADELSAASVHLLLGIGALNHVWIDSIDGLKAVKHKPSLSWFTVHARFAIQIESQTKGMQTYEERFVAVKATSFEEAVRIVRPEFRAYARPYLNPAGEMVRWQFEKVVNVYDMGEVQFDGSPVEVFSTLKKRRMRPDLAWQPRRQR
jgi:hypothetical protein